MHELENIDQAVSIVRQIKSKQERLAIINELLRGKIDYSTPEGRVIGTRRALLCSRLTKEGLWP